MSGFPVYQRFGGWQSCIVDLLRGIGLSGYRSFGHERFQYLAPLTGVNLVAGQNNAGKSNLLRVVDSVLPPVVGTPQHQRNPLDVPAGALAGDGRKRVAIAIDSEIIGKRLPRLPSDVLPSLYECLSRPDTEGMWVEYVFDESENLQLDTEWMVSATRRLGGPGRRNLQRASSAVSSTGGGQEYEDLSRVLGALNVAANLPGVETIPAFRQIKLVDERSSGQGAETFDGLGIISRLAVLQSPSAVNHREREKFDSIQDFVRNVLDDPGLEISVPNDRDTINVRLSGGALLPLENMGTGIHQVVILAVAATLITEKLVCMEEPEIHLHPILQRKLLQYLATKTSNQYLIATHSAHMLDAEVASIFHLTRGDAGTQIRAAVTPSDRAGICADLGYRSSDLVQANAIVWVEGPSDRVYLRKWIEVLAPDLIEGTHYSMMFYGGRLLNHLSADDPDVEDFISLRRLNRHVAIVIDSDKLGPRRQINPTKKRVVSELREGGVAWVTSCYTMENYIPEDLFAEAVKASHPSGKFTRMDRWGNPLAAPAYEAGSPKADKLKIARYIANNWGTDSPWPYDLRDRVRELVQFIDVANGLIKPRW